MKKSAGGILLASLLVLTIYYFLPEQRLPTDKKIDKLVVRKSKNVLEVYSGDEKIKTYPIAIGKNSVGDKESEGDKRTPEGTYYINDKNPKSGYHKNLGISYPNKKDAEEAAAKNVKPGGAVKIHGLRNGMGFIGKFHRWMNWTAGCIALTDKEVDELYDRVAIGTPIVIKP